jgi:hypothetical protein
MRDAGYSDSYADNAGVTKTKTWEEELEEQLPDSLLLTKHVEGLEADLVKTATHQGSIDDERFYTDFATRFKYLDSGYKLKKKYDESVKIKHQFGELSDEELEGAISGIISDVIGAIAGKGKKS